MKNGRLQCKDIPDEPILRLMATHPHVGGLIYYKASGKWPNIWPAMPEGVSESLALAKMASLIRRKLASGCACGCRGDFEITKAGLEWLEKRA